MEFPFHPWCQCLTGLTLVSLILTIAKVRSVSLYDYGIEDVIINALRHKQEVKQQQQQPEPRDEGVLGCHIKEYFQPIDKSLVLSTGEIWPCYDNVTVKACWGSCDSSEVADYKSPYKISNHPVCMYTGRNTKRVKLTYCHDNHPDPWVDVFDATGCTCQHCNDDNTYCEHLNG